MTVHNGEQILIVEGYKNENGIVLYSLREIVEFYEYVCGEHDRCGHDEVYLKEGTSEYGAHIVR